MQRPRQKPQYKGQNRPKDALIATVRENTNRKMITETDDVVSLAPVSLPSVRGSLRS